MLTGSPSTIGTTALVVDAVVFAIELLRSSSLLAAVERSPSLLVAVERSPSLLVAVELGAVADPLEAVEVNPPHALRPPARSIVSNVISLVLNLHPTTISPLLLH
jgi:hypothetical protein